MNMTCTVAEVATLAKGAAFYVTPEGMWLRMNYVMDSEGYFCATEEDSGNEYTITFATVAATDDVYFAKVVRMELPTESDL